MLPILISVLACAGQHKPLATTSAQPPVTERASAPLSGAEDLADQARIMPWPPLGVGWAWSAGSLGEDRATALAATDGSGFYMTAHVSGNRPQSLPVGELVVRIGPDGTILWSQDVAGLDAGVSLRQVLPTDDGGAWVCGLALGGAAIMDRDAVVPPEWDAALLALHLGPQGELDETRVLGPLDGGGISGTCGVDPAGRMIIEGMVDQSELQLIVNDSRVMVSDQTVEQGFVLVLSPDGTWERLTTWRAPSAVTRASAVLEYGSVMLNLGYTGAPLFQIGPNISLPLKQCLPGVECDVLVHLDAQGGLHWADELGPTGPGRTLLVATPDDGVLFSRPVPVPIALPQAEDTPVLVPAGGPLIARYNRKMGVQWVTRAGAELSVDALAGTESGGALVGMWTRDAALARLGATKVLLDHRRGTMALGEVGRTGATRWLTAAEGPGQAWPTSLASGDNGFVVAGMIRGLVRFDAGGPTDTQVESLRTPLGVPTVDVMTAHLVPRWPIIEVAAQ